MHQREESRTKYQNAHSPKRRWESEQEVRADKDSPS